MDANDYATACPKLEEAVKLVPEGIGAKLTLAECYEGIGKLASAWSQYEIGKSLAERAGQKERAERAAARAEALRGRLATLTIEVPEAVQKIPGVTVARAGAALGREQWGMALPVDVGSYEITATAPGYKPWTRNVEVLKDGESASVRVDEIAPIECARPAEECKRPVAPVVVQRAAPETSWRRVLGLGLMGLGAEGLILGAVLGGLAIQKNVQSKAGGLCTAEDYCKPEGLELRSEAVGLGNGSTAALVLGGAALVGGVALFATAPASTSKGKEQKRPAVGAALELLPAGLRVRGEF